MFDSSSVLGSHKGESNWEIVDDPHEGILVSLGLLEGSPGVTVSG